MTGRRAVRLGGTPAAPSPFGVISTLEFGGADGFGAAIGARGSTVFGDVPDFSDERLQVMVGEVTGHG